MKVRVDVDGQSYLLQLQKNGDTAEYLLEGAEQARGSVSVVEVTRGVFSVLLGHKSFTVHTSEKNGVLEVWSATQRHFLSVVDARDRAISSKKVAAGGRAEIRAQMPGKVVKLLVAAGSTVQAGDGVIVVEAMKMQNEMKSPKDGVVSHIRVQEGSTVTAGEAMMVIE